MKVLIVSQYFWPENFRINEVAIQLKKHGCDVEILTGKPNYPGGNFFTGYSTSGLSFEYWMGIKVYRLPILPRGKATGIRLLINYFSFVFSGLLFGPIILRKSRYDIIFVYAPSPIIQVIPALLLGGMRKIPVVLWVQDLWPESLSATGHIKSSTILHMVRILVKLIYRQVNLILVQSQAFIKPVSNLAPAARVLYYPNSVEKYFYNLEPCDIPNIGALNEGFTLLFAGNVGVAQSMETIVSAASRLRDYPEIKFIILGAGSKLKWTESEIKSRGLKNIILGGRYPLETMPHLMRKASALLVTLNSDPIFSLTIPNKIQAYMAVGKPIIACINGEGARIIKEANSGLTVAAEDSIGLATAILTMYKMTEVQRCELGQNGRRFFKANFDEDFLINKLISHFQNLISREKY